MIRILPNSRCRLEAELGRGGMGVLHRAHDTLLERDVAVRVLMPSISAEWWNVTGWLAEPYS